MKQIVIDINGLDHGPQAYYEACSEFLIKHQDTSITLVGEISKLPIKNQVKNLILIDNSYKVFDPKNIRQNLKEPTSMNQAIQMLVEGKADGIISGGDSGMYISALTLKAGRLQGTLRPAFMPIISALNGKKVLLLDVGANLEVKAEYLYQWAKLAQIFSQKMFKVQSPKITLLNIGTEEYKGLEHTKEAAKLLLADDSLNYVGFSESRELLRANYDIALVDGYGGNLILKSYEGAILSFKDAIKESALKRIRTKLGALLLKPTFKEIMQKLDYRNSGAAWILGVAKPALKIHGSSDKVAILYALDQMHKALDTNLITDLQGVQNGKI
ncbi:phosphate acyltransferase [Mycoplasmopsis bovirhinis]|uniref:phosphate acyltransferase PlsX n=1 Tax=Mycoplasmopsis bovirhinis TaxID=29553 RepID=UPI000BB9BFAD|nr:phosphate acyltransferase PlsX [Mycoplasmopsis bovirhinis]BBA22316.1 phosphate acyltransferase [Mycoplasmopsis bovirhinis]